MKGLFKLLYKLLLVGLLVLIGYFPIWGYNYFIDPYGIFRTDFMQQEIEPNQRFIKTRFLVKHGADYDGILFGSSRVGSVDVAHMQPGRVYNMTYSAGMPDEHLYDLKLLVDSGAHFDKVYVGIDNITLYYDHSDHENQPMRRRYVRGRELLSFYLSYLTETPSEHIKEEIKREKEFRIFYDIYQTGRPFVLGLDASIEADIDAHVNAYKFTYPSWQDSYVARIDERLMDLRALKDYCDAQNMELIVFINPMHHLTYRRMDFDDYSAFLKGLSDITGFYDFAGLNDITLNNYHYYETSHYRPHVGTMMAETFNGTGSFGHWIDHTTIDTWIDTLRKQLAY